jgi:hypothetical protein
MSEAKVPQDARQQAFERVKKRRDSGHTSWFS